MSLVNRDSKKMIMEDVTGQPVYPQELSNRHWISVDITFKCIYIQGGSKANYGVSRELVKLVVGLPDEDEMQPLAPAPKRAKKH